MSKKITKLYQKKFKKHVTKKFKQFCQKNAKSFCHKKIVHKIANKCYKVLNDRFQIFQISENFQISLTHLCPTFGLVISHLSSKILIFEKILFTTVVSIPKIFNMAPYLPPLKNVDPH